MTPKVFVRFVLSLLAMMLVVTDADAQSSVVDSVRSLFEVDDSASATALARAAVQTRPQDADSHCAMAVVYDMAEEQESAVESAERCVELEPNSSDNQYILADASMELAGQKGGLGALGPARRGKAAAEKAIELDPDNLNARILLFFFHMQAPGIAGGSKKEAERQTVEISKRDPAMGVYTRYRLRLDKADDDELAALFKAALPQCGPTDSLSYAIATATGTAVRVEDDALAEELVVGLREAGAQAGGVGAVPACGGACAGLGGAAAGRRAAEEGAGPELGGRLGVRKPGRESEAEGCQTKSLTELWVDCTITLEQ
jgi:tetratricopeptide (TPR) repeat protein